MSKSLILVASLLALSSPSLAVATPEDTPEVIAPFQLNLARSFSSTVEQLKKRGGNVEPKVSRAKERSISDELVALLKLAGAGHAYEASPSQHTAAAAGSKPSKAWDPSAETHAASKPTGSHKPSKPQQQGGGGHALAGKPYESKPKPNGASKAYNTHLASPTDQSSPTKPHSKPSAAYNTHAAVAPPPSKPSKSPSDPSSISAALPGASAVDHMAKRSPNTFLEEVQKRIQEEPWENLDSGLLCPLGETACPIFPRMGTYECVDTSSELENCGGCASRSLGEDCTLLKGALGLACQSGKCNVFTCQPGYKFVEDGRDGHGECVGAGKRKGGFFGARSA
ncbi:hypothetical protein JCM16303_001072 [Sporobolomyces ruberrimus]